MLAYFPQTNHRTAKEEAEVSIPANQLFQRIRLQQEILHNLREYEVGLCVAQVNVIRQLTLPGIPGGSGVGRRHPTGEVKIVANGHQLPVGLTKQLCVAAQGQVPISVRDQILEECMGYFCSGIEILLHVSVNFRYFFQAHAVSKLPLTLNQKSGEMAFFVSFPERQLQ